jgi:DMSO/TMAO reductase YedYZ molybdopterin-dependent catalytic subunit
MASAEFSGPGRIAAAGEAITAQELALAARNHGMPLEALRYDLTPPGLHYLLIHYDIPAIESQQWKLSVGGKVARPWSFDLASLQERPATTVRVTLECAGNGRARLDPRPVSQPWLVEAVGTAEWTGVPLRDVLDEAGLAAEATEVVFTGADHGYERGVEQDYQRSLTVAEAMRPEMLLAYQMNGAPLPPQHGYPLRLIAPGWYGMAHVKWLSDIEVIDSTFTGFQQSVAYRYRQEAAEQGEPVTRMEPRALLVPPGFPDFMSRKRIVTPGLHTLEGRAWSGKAPIVAVEVSTDGGAHWEAATLDDGDAHPFAWKRFTYRWAAVPGHHQLTSRARDADGNTQSVDQLWNRGGFANNAIHLIDTFCME